ncbi:unnamed protein product, partial [Meganyctiphanes norvegica]
QIKQPSFWHGIALETFLNDALEYVQHDTTIQGRRLHQALTLLKAAFEKLNKQYIVLVKDIHLYDFNADTPGNGFRSFVNIAGEVKIAVSQLCQQIVSHLTCCSTKQCKKDHFSQEVEVWVQAIESLSSILEYVNTKLLSCCHDGYLYPAEIALFPEDINNADCDYPRPDPDELLAMISTLDLTPFYGKRLGFHFPPSLRNMLSKLNFVMASFSHMFYSTGGKISRSGQFMSNAYRYRSNLEVRSQRIVDVIDNCTVDFVKSFWSFGEVGIMKKVPALLGKSLSVNVPIIVPCEEMTATRLDDGSTLVIPVPHSHLPPAPIKCHLLSKHAREEMVNSFCCKRKCLPKSDHLLIHFHGGGFVTQSTNAQEPFLREWAHALEVPILSCDYTLSPEAKYPRPLEEALTVYCWALNNLNLLGTNANTIVLTGDSAGGNMITGLTIKCIELGIRPPDGLYLAYTPFIFDLMPAPARLLAVMDPMLPFAFALRCLKAYAGDRMKKSTENSSPIPTPPVENYSKRPKFCSIPLGTTPLHYGGEQSLKDEFSTVVIEDDHYLSALKCPKHILSKFPSTAIMTVEYDFCLDDNVTMGKKLKSVGVDVTVDILNKLPHGFMNLCLVSKEAMDGVKSSIERLKDLFGITN